MIKEGVHSIVPSSPIIPLESTNAQVQRAIRETQAEGPEAESRFPSVKDALRSVGLGQHYDRSA
jgi:hypothetical protein